MSNCSALSSHNQIPPVITQTNLLELIPDTYDVHPGTHVTIRCAPGLQLVGDNALTCLTSGEWSYTTKPYCKEIQADTDSAWYESTRNLIIVCVIWGLAAVVFLALLIKIITMKIRKERHDEVDKKQLHRTGTYVHHEHKHDKHVELENHEHVHDHHGKGHEHENHGQGHAHDHHGLVQDHYHHRKGHEHDNHGKGHVHDHHGKGHVHDNYGKGHARDHHGKQHDHDHHGKRHTHDHEKGHVFDNHVHENNYYEGHDHRRHENNHHREDYFRGDYGMNYHSDSDEFVIDDNESVPGFDFQLAETYRF